MKMVLSIIAVASSSNRRFPSYLERSLAKTMISFIPHHLLELPFAAAGATSLDNDHNHGSTQAFTPWVSGEAVLHAVGIS